MNEESPLVSVIIPTYNRASIIERAIQSVLKQSYRNLEIIVVDDASKDNTNEIVRNIKDNRLIYKYHEKNKGPSSARNTGIKAASGEYISFQDSDDVWHTQKLEKQMNYILNKPTLKSCVVYSRILRLENNKKTNIPSESVERKEGNIYRYLLKGNFIAMPSIVVHRGCFNKTGLFDEELKILEDWDLILRLSKYFRFEYINEPLVISYHTPKGVNSNYAELGKALEKILLKNYEDYKSDKKILAKMHYNIGYYSCLEENNYIKGKKCFKEAFKIEPHNIKYFISMVASISGNDKYIKLHYINTKCKQYFSH